MSLGGLEALLEAAQYLEQQEQLKSSPTQSSMVVDRSVIYQSPSSAATHIIRYPQQQQQQHIFDIVPSSPSATASSNMGKQNHRNSPHSVVSLATEATSTILLANGGRSQQQCGNNQTINNGSQLSAIQKHFPNDYESSNNDNCNGVTIAAPNGRSIQGLMNVDESYMNDESPSYVMLPTPSKMQKSSNDHHSSKSELPLSLGNSNGHSNNNSTLAIVNNLNASQHMLLNGGVRISSPAAAAVATAGSATTPIVINVASNGYGGGGTIGGKAATIINIPQSCTSNNYVTNSSSIGQAVTFLPSTSSGTSGRHKKSVPLTPPPISSRKLVEASRIRSFSLSSNKIAANNNNNLAALSKGTGGGGSITQSTVVLGAQNSISHQKHLNIVEDLAVSVSSAPGYGHTISSSGAGSSSPSLLGQHQSGGVNNNKFSEQYMHMVNTQPATVGSGGGRRRTISSNSNGAGTREVHNKLEKNRRAHLKECYEALKNQLHLKDEDRKKTSNLAILGAARKHIEALQRKDQELEQQVEQLAKEKINAQKKIVSLKRELGPKYEHFFANIITDIELGTIPVETESHSESGSLSSGRGSILYSSSSSLSSSGGNTISSPLGASMQNAVSGELSPVTSQLSSGVSSSTMIKSSPPSPSASSLSPSCMISNETSTNVTNSGIPLSLTAKNISATSLTRGSPTPSNPSPSPSSSGVSSSSSIISTSPPMSGNGISLKVSTSMKSECGNSSNNIPNGVKLSNDLCSTTMATASPKVDSEMATIVSTSSTSTNGNTFVSSPVINITSLNKNNGATIVSSNSYNATSISGMSLNITAAVAAVASTLKMTTSSISKTSLTTSSSTSPSSSSSLEKPSSSSSSSPTLTPTSTLSPAVVAASFSTLPSPGIGNKNFSNGLKHGNSRKTPFNLVCDQNGESFPDALSSNIRGINNRAKNSQLNHQRHIISNNGGVRSKLDEGEQPAKVIKVFNGIALASATTTASEKKSHANILSTNGQLQLSQVVGGGSLVVSPFLSSPTTQSLRIIGANNLATIELNRNNNFSSCSSGVNQLHNQMSSSPPVTLSTNGGAQLHKLLMSGGNSTTTANGNTAVNGGIGDGGCSLTTVATSESGRLPGGAELNILPTATATDGPTSSSSATAALYHHNSSGNKLVVANNGNILKGSDYSRSNAIGSGSGLGTVHVVTPIHNQQQRQQQQHQTSVGLASTIVVSPGQQINNLAHLIADPSSPIERLSGKVNLSVSGQTLPLISTQYLSAMKPMVVTVAAAAAASSSSSSSSFINGNNNNCNNHNSNNNNNNNKNHNNNINNSNNNSNPTLSSSVPPTLTSKIVSTGTTNGNNNAL